MNSDKSQEEVKCPICEDTVTIISMEKAMKARNLGHAIQFMTTKNKLSVPRKKVKKVFGWPCIVEFKNGLSINCLIKRYGVNRVKIEELIREYMTK